MPMNKWNQRTFHRHLYAGMLKSITLQKRGYDQKEGTIISYRLFECRRSMIHKTGEPIAGDMSSNHHTVWHIPRIEMDRVGLYNVDAGDIIIEDSVSPNQNRKWVIESTNAVTIKLWEDHICCACYLWQATNK